MLLLISLGHGNIASESRGCALNPAFSSPPRGPSPALVQAAVNLKAALVTSNKYCSNRGGAGGSNQYSKNVGGNNMAACEAFVLSTPDCGRWFDYGVSDGWCDCVPKSASSCTENSAAGYNVYHLVVQNTDPAFQPERPKQPLIDPPRELQPVLSAPRNPQIDPAPQPGRAVVAVTPNAVCFNPESYALRVIPTTTIGGNDSKECETYCAEDSHCVAFAFVTPEQTSDKCAAWRDKCFMYKRAGNGETCQLGHHTCFQMDTMAE